MAKVFLDSADSITIGNNQNNVSVYGTTGVDSVNLLAGLTLTTADQNVDKVLFSGAISSYKFVQAGNGIKVYDSTGATLIASVSAQPDADGTALTFTDGTASAKLVTGAAGTVPTMTLGGTTISSTTTPGAVVPTTFDTAIKTPAPTGGTVTPPTPTGNASSVDGLGTDATAATPLSLASSGAFNYTDNVATRSNVTISGFGADDSITITGSTAAIYDNVISSAGSDVSISYNNGGVLNLITLVGVNAGGAFVNSVSSFNALPVGDLLFA